MATLATSSALRISLKAPSVAKLPLPQISWASKTAVLTRFSPLRAASVHSRLSHSNTRYFHNSPSRQILPAPPQRVAGTVNDPAPTKEPHPIHGSYHWTFERLVSLGLVPLTVAPFAAGSLNPTMDAVLCTTLLIHTHIGFQSVVIDYVPQVRMPKIHALFWWGLRAGTVLVGIGLYQFETNDVGLTETIKKVWAA